ncbi:MAG: hypothetical protein GWP91_07500 [Rhodobacterales bacterium]|nr:hypothetical protein [Rhodobacterales bacterium]
MLVFLISTVAMAEEAGGGFTISEMWQHAGFIARAVIITLVLMLVGTVFTSFERMMAFNRARKQSVAFASAIVGPLQKQDLDAALTLCDDETFKASYLAGLLRAGLREMHARQDRTGLDNAQRAVEKAHYEELAKMKKGMTVLATTGSTAPFVGLLGTTFGVINAFQGMAEEGSGLASISAGISEALITTGVGIGVAIAGVWAFNYFNFRSDKVRDELESSEADFTDWAEKLLQSATAGK